ncbi:MAG: ABC transporter substrate-binding protein [Methanotrichaceae archaeon]|nr:ABC transporter substrate-binding protein [Methanotrichaceae archaeon]
MRTIISFMMAVCVIFAFFAFSATANGGSENKTIQVTDDRGRTIEVPYPCERIVFLVENAMNTMYAVDGADNISGIGDIWMPEQREPLFKAIDPNFDSKVRISKEGGMVNMETLAKADPQLVVLWSADWDDDVTQAIEENLNVPTYGVFIDSTSDLQRQAEVFGQIIDREKRAAEVVNIMKLYEKKVTDDTSTIPQEEKPKVYWMWGDILGTAGLKSTANELIEKAGGVNVMQLWTNETRTLEHPTLNLETLVQLNPDVIYMWFNTNLDPEDIVNGKDFEGWKDINAVKNGRVYEVENPLIFDFHTPRYPLALMIMAKDINPDKFQDLDLDAEIDNMFVDLYQVHYPGFEAASGSA